MIVNHPEELTCDMAEVYGVFDIKRVPARLLATLAVGLRNDSRVKLAMAGAKCDDKTYLLAVIADNLRVMSWRMTEDGAEGMNPPKLFTDYYQGKEEQEREYLVFDSPEAFDAKWKEITGN